MVKEKICDFLQLFMFTLSRSGHIFTLDLYQICQNDLVRNCLCLHLVGQDTIFTLDLYQFCQNDLVRKTKLLVSQ